MNHAILISTLLTCMGWWVWFPIGRVDIFPVTLVKQFRAHRIRAWFGGLKRVRIAVRQVYRRTRAINASDHHKLPSTTKRFNLVYLFFRQVRQFQSPKSISFICIFPITTNAPRITGPPQTPTRRFFRNVNECP